MNESGTWGLYHKDVDPEFSNGNSFHFGVWGRTLGLAVGLIEEVVTAHEPDMILLLMGFNDFGW